MKVLRILLKIAVLPLMLLVALVYFVFSVLTNLSCYVIGPLMLLILGCGIYTVVKQQWSQTFLLTLMEAACLLLLFGAGFVLVTLESWQEGLGDFLHS